MTDDEWTYMDPREFRESRGTYSEEELVELFRDSWEYETAERIANNDVPEGVDTESDSRDIARWAELKLKGESDPELRWVDTAFRAWLTGTMAGTVFNDEDLDEMDRLSEAEMERQRMSKEYRIKDR